MAEAVTAAAIWIGQQVGTAVGATLTAAGVSASTALPIASTLASAAYYVSQAALYAGLSYAIDAVTRPEIKPPGAELTMNIDPAYPREMVIGERQVGGSLVARYSRDVNNYFAHVVIQVADHPCVELSKIYDGGRLVQDTPLEHGVRTEITSYSNSGGPRLWMTWHDGRPGQTADADLVTKSATDPEVVAGKIDAWTTDHKGAGCAYVHIEIRWDPDILTSVPQFTFLTKGARLYDRRKDSTAGGSGAHRHDDPATWEYSTNAMVALDHFLLGYKVESDPLAFGIGLSKVEVPYDQFAAAADLCDEDVETGVGGAVETIKRYAANGVISAGDYFQEVIEAFQVQMAARVVDLGGRIGILGAEERAITVSLTEDDLISGEPLQYADKLDFADLIGSVTGTFSDPANNYQPTPYDPLYTQYQALPDGGEAQAVTLTLPYEVHPRRAARLVSAYAARETLQPRLAAVFKPKAWTLEAGDWFEFTSPRLQVTAAKFEVVDIVKNDDFTVIITARAIDPNFLAFDNDNDPSLSVPPDIDPVSRFLTAPEFDVLVSTITAGSVVEPVLEVTLTSDENVANQIVFEYAVWDSGAAPGDEIVGPTQSDAMQVSQVVTKLRKSILPSSQYAVRAKSKAGLRESPWTAWSTPVTTGATYAVGSAASVPWSGVADDGGRPDDNADVTSTNTAAAIAGQGALATLSQVALGSGGRVYRDDGTTRVTDALAITSLGTAAAIAAQGALATLSSINSSGLIGSGVVVYTALATTAVRLGTNIVRADGTTSLTDALAVTSLGTAAAFTGQGALATLSTINSTSLMGSAVVAYTALTTTAVRLGTNIVRNDGTTSLTDALAVTSLGTAAAIASQGALATLSQVAIGASGRVYRDDGTTRLTDALAVTSLGTAAAIASQGALATLSTINSSGLMGSAVVAYTALTSTAVRLGTNIVRNDGTTSLTDALAVTSLGTAAAIASQGALATASSAAWGSQISSRPANLAALSGSEAVNNALVPAGANGLVDTGFRWQSTYWSRTQVSGSTAWSVTETAEGLRVGILTGAGVTVNGTDYILGSSQLQRTSFPCKAGDTVGLRVLVGSDNASSIQLRIMFRNAAGTLINSALVTLSSGLLAGTGDETTFNEMTATGVAGAGALTVNFEIRAIASTAAPVLRLAKPMLALLPTGQTAIPVYSPGREHEIGANVTETRTAAAFTGQGALAVLSTINSSALMGSAVVLYTALSTTAVRLGTNIVRNDGTTSLTDALAVTSLGTAAAIASQGALATLSTINSSGLMGSGVVAYTALTTTAVRLGVNITRNDGSTSLTDALAVTSLGTAAAITSQGALATASQVNIGASGQVYRDDATTRLTDALAVTSLGTAAAIASQGALATLSTINSSGLMGSAVVAYTALTSTAVRLGTNIVRNDGTTSLTDALAVTSLGTAAAIASQGALATLSTINSSGLMGSAVVAYTALTSTAVRLGTNIVRADGSTSLTDALAVTSLGTAAAFTGQGALATLSTINSTSLMGSAVVASTALTATAVRLNTNIVREDGTTALTDALAVTSLGTAAAITSQGALATLGQVNLGASGRVYRDDGTTRLTDALAVTALGTAAAIASQGALATLSTINSSGLMGSSVVAYTALTSTAVRLGTNITRNDGSTSLTDALAVTSLGTAAAIAGQGSLATVSRANVVALSGSEAINNALLTPQIVSLLTAVMPGRPAVGDDFTAAGTSSGTPAAIAVLSAGSVVNVANEGDVRQFTTLENIATRGWLPVVSNRTYRLTFRSRVTVDGTDNRLFYGFTVFAADGTFLATLSFVAADAAHTVADGWVTYSFNITGATILASQSTAAWVRGRVTGGRNGSATYSGATWQLATMLLEPLQRLADGSLVREDGTTSLTDALAVTSLGTAAAIASQGALATLSTINSTSLMGSAVVAYTALTTTAVRLGTNITRNDGSTSLTDALAVTSLGTAAAIASQGALATLSTINSSGLMGSGVVAYTALTTTAVRLSVNITRADGTTSLTDALAVTSLGTAAAISGQGALATLNTAGTSQLAANAVTSGTVFENDAAQAFDQTWTSVASISITTPDANSLIFLPFSAYVESVGFDATIGQARIKRDSTVIYETDIAGEPPTLDFETPVDGVVHYAPTFNGQCSGFDTDAPGAAGTYTYTLEFRTNGSGSNALRFWQATRRRFLGLLFKR